VKPKILVIDDNREIRENIAEILELAGYESLTAPDGKKGIEMAISDKPSIIICDIMMPELDGYGVLHLLQRNPEVRNTPFIFLTAKTERSDFRKGMEMGADDYITKPFEEIELLNAVEARLKKLEISRISYTDSQNGFVKFLKDVSDAGLIKLMNEQFEVHACERKSILYSQGKKPRYLFFLVSGKVKTSRTHDDGKEYILGLFKAGDFLGYNAILKEDNYEETAIILEEADIMQIPKEEFLKMLFSDVTIARKFIEIMAQNQKENEERLLNLAYSSLRKRVAKALVEINEKFNRGSRDPLEISREELAQYIGTATESLIRTLSDFKSEKLIETKNSKITISDPSKLKNLSF
jgi:CRP-like cAMP-binding protein/ActR/RegA family two-component response regulator